MHDMLGPLKGLCPLIASLCKLVYGATDIPGGGGTQPAKGLPGQYAEPALDLVQP